MPLFFRADQESLTGWIKANRPLLKSSLPDVDGNSILMLLIKMRTSFAQGLHELPATMLKGEQQSFAAMLGCWRQFLGLLAQEEPRQLNIADFKGQTPLMLLAESGDTELVRIMLKAGADPEKQDYQCMTALHSAIKSHVNSCVDVLLDHPCDLDKCTHDGQSPLHTASWSANLPALKRLLQMAPGLAWQRNTHKMTPLELVEYLIEYPQALQHLAEQRRQDGKRCATRKELEAVVLILEQATPVATP